VLESLKVWGPHSHSTLAMTLPEAQAYCRQLALGHYENFPVVTWLLPRDVRPHFYSIYAYCRWSDDLADEISDPAESLRLLDWWENQLLACYQRIHEHRTQLNDLRTETGFVHPVFVALEHSILACSLPIEPFRDLLSAFRQDQNRHQYESFDDLQNYCRRSADPVGRLILHVCGLANPDNFALSDSICTGLQLANFWQDISRDADRGRTYLPREDRKRFGYSDSNLAERKTNAAFVELMKFEVERARRLLLDGRPLVDRFPRRMKFDIEMFIRGGLCILDRIQQQNFSVWGWRPKLNKSDFLQIAWHSLRRLL
ncbi:MAG: squalene synthase HpnC, partial [Planctomycetaceae bacterium]